MSDEDKTVIADIGSMDYQPVQKKDTEPCLVQYNGTALGKRYVLSGESLKVGRSVDADVTIGESSVSRIHARISHVGDQITLEDTGSANGTFINDEKVVGSMPLKDQDMVRLGGVILKFFSSGNMDGYVQDKIYRMATIDAGTDIFNKQYLLDALESEFQASKSSGRNLSIIYYDLDHFKKVNDTYGHNAGDQVLREGSDLVKGLVRKDDILGRFGGEEFVIILPNTDARTAYDLAERIRKSMEAYTFQLDVTSPDGQKQVVAHKQTFSVGVSQLSPDMSAAKELMESADKKLYTSKQSGRNRVTI